MTYKEWLDNFQPIKNHIDPNVSFDGYVFKTSGPELEYVMSQPANRIWTVFDTDGGTYMSSGISFANRMGYVLTAVPFKAGDSHVVEDDLDLADEEIEDDEIEFAVMRSYTITELHKVEAASADEAIALVDGDEHDYFVKSYDGPYDKDEDGNILYDVESEW